MLQVLALCVLCNSAMQVKRYGAKCRVGREAEQRRSTRQGNAKARETHERLLFCITIDLNLGTSTRATLFNSAAPVTESHTLLSPRQIPGPHKRSKNAERFLGMPTTPIPTRTQPLFAIPDSVHPPSMIALQDP